MQAHYERLLEESDNSPEMLSACVKGLRRIGQMRVINNDLGGAAAPLQRAQQLVEQQLSKFPNQEALLAEFAQILHIQGAMFDSQFPPQFNEARASYEKSIEILRRLAATGPSSTYHRKLARGCISQAFVLRSIHQPGEALEMIQDSIRILDELLEKAPDEWLPHEDLASALNVRYLIYSDLGEIELAGTSLRSGIAIRESLAHSHPDFQKNSIRLGINYGNYGKYVHIEGHVEQALEFYDRATGKLEPIFRRNQDLPECRNALRNIYSRRAIAFEQLGRFADAVGNWESAIGMEHAPRRQILKARLALAKNEPLEAVGLVKAYLGREGISSEELFDCGRVYARASQLVADDNVRAEYEREVLRVVDQALARGYSVINKDDYTLAHDFAKLSLWGELQKRFLQ